MAMSHLFVTLLAATAILCSPVEADAPPPSKIPPGWMPFKDLKDNKVVAIAEFAVKSYNEAFPEHKPLKLVSVDKGEYLVAVGANYHLYITASSEDVGIGRYQTFVFQFPSGKWDLTSFVRID